MEEIAGLPAFFTYTGRYVMRALFHSSAFSSRIGKLIDCTHLSISLPLYKSFSLAILAVSSASFFGSGLASLSYRLSEDYPSLQRGAVKLTLSGCGFMKFDIY
jgi:hypothetical protein